MGIRFEDQRPQLVAGGGGDDRPAQPRDAPAQPRVGPDDPSGGRSAGMGAVLGRGGGGRRVPLGVPRDLPGPRGAVDGGAWRGVARRRCPGSRDRRGAGHHRAQAGRRAASAFERGVGGAGTPGGCGTRSGPGARGARRTDAGAGPACRRHRARLQQRAAGGRRGRQPDCTPAGRRRSGGPLLSYHSGCRQPRLLDHAPAADVRAPERSSRRTGRCCGDAAGSGGIAVSHAGCGDQHRH